MGLVKEDAVIQEVVLNSYLRGYGLLKGKRTRNHERFRTVPGVCFY